MSEKQTPAVCYIIDYSCECGGNFIGRTLSFMKNDKFLNICTLCGKQEYLDKHYPTITHKGIEQ